MKILGIEASCDETSVAIVEGRTKEEGVNILSNIIASQVNLHKKFGGVVPEVAARAHIENIIPAIKAAFSEAECRWNDIENIGVTIGPGLVGSLMIGLETAKFLALSKKKKIIGINHLEGHIYANFIREIPNPKSQIPKFPLICLIVSGGHTILVYMEDHLKYKIIGQTRDDAAGEAFDKVAKLLDLGYPGGPIISKTAEKGDINSYKFPIVDLTPEAKRDMNGFLVRPEKSLDFSFSGLKTAVLNKIKNEKGEVKKADLAASFQKNIVDNLVINTIESVKRYKVKTVLLAGGVAANSLLREELRKNLKKLGKDIFFGFPKPILCTDNAAMIATAGYFHALKKGFNRTKDLIANPGLNLI